MVTCQPDEVSDMDRCSRGQLFVDSDRLAWRIDQRKIGEGPANVDADLNRPPSDN